jgi:hypothetical protein
MCICRSAADARLTVPCPGQHLDVLSSAVRAARIAATRTPIRITHGTSDPVLPVLRDAYVAAGVDPCWVVKQ